MSDKATARPAICLNMIVRNEAHVVAELLDAVAPYISSWAIVDTGSGDGTLELIRAHMRRLGIPGELHERPWRDFGTNRTEALTLAQAHGDYIWVMDADDTLVGTPDFTGLDADVYWVRYKMKADIYFRSQLFRDGLSVRWVGVTHEGTTWDYQSCVEGRLEGDYHIADRQISARNLGGQKYERDRDLLLAEVERNPDDARSVFYLAQSYFDLRDFANARKWYARRAEMGGYGEEVYFALYRVAHSMLHLDERRADIQDVFLRAWESRPTRAEPLFFMACYYREDQRYQLAYEFANWAATIPYPEQDTLFVRTDIYNWRTADELGVCGCYLDKRAESFTLFRRVLARSDVPDDERPRIAANRDLCVPPMIEAASAYPDPALLRSLQRSGQGDADVLVSLIAGPDRGRTEKTLNSFLRCCTDISRIGRFLVIDAGLSAHDRALLHERYEFLEFARPGQLGARIDARRWLHLGQDWLFFAPEPLVTRLMAVLEAEPEVFQVAINYTDADQLTGGSAPEHAVRRAPDTGRYVPAEEVALGPAMFDTARLDRAGGLDPIAELGRRAAAAGLRTATLNEVLCVRQD